MLQGGRHWQMHGCMELNVMLRKLWFSSLADLHLVATMGMAFVDANSREHSSLRALAAALWNPHWVSLNPHPFPAGCSQPVAEWGKDTKTSPILGNMKLPCWLTLTVWMFLPNNPALLLLHMGSDLGHSLKVLSAFFSSLSISFCTGASPREACALLDIVMSTSWQTQTDTYRLYLLQGGYRNTG